MPPRYPTARRLNGAAGTGKLTNESNHERRKSKNGALAGIKVVDLTRVLSGPYATQILADHGAEVIKVEPPLGDEVRDWGPPFYEGDASYFIGLNETNGLSDRFAPKRGPRRTAAPSGRSRYCFEELKTGQMEKFGLGYEDVLKEKFPKLIYCRIGLRRADGPLGGFPGYGGHPVRRVGLA